MTIEEIARAALECRKKYIEASVAEGAREKALKAALGTPTGSLARMQYGNAALEAQTLWNSYEAAKIALWTSCDAYKEKET